MEELISAFANNSNKIYESVGSNLSSKGRFELIRSNDWVTPNQSDIEEPLLNTQDLFQQLREDLANLNWEPNIDYNDPFKSREARQNTIEDFYTFLHDKFGLSPMRPDAKTIRDNVDKQIKEAKSLST